eukprot:m.658935 g.658935  ORF g.658935 m.658935 type:complete len:158 (+) comp22721_c0_seq1:113-586(+)
MLRVFAAAATGFGVGAAVFLPSKLTQNHCQVPCGIFDDKAKIAELMQHTTTIAKAINQVQTLAVQKDAQSLNQSVRWINTKEEHCDKIIETVSKYFLTQKVKEVSRSDEKHQAYLMTLEKHHLVMRAAMKAKQSTDSKAADDLKDVVHVLSHLYGEA